MSPLSPMVAAMNSFKAMPISRRYSTNLGYVFRGVPQKWIKEGISTITLDQTSCAEYIALLPNCILMELYLMQMAHGIDCPVRSRGRDPISRLYRNTV